jgi:Ni,Fe-hydrogenase III large subunit/Ni,Fe-hydrogenase III component G
MTRKYIPTRFSSVDHGNIATFEVQPSEILTVFGELLSNDKLEFKLIEATDESSDQAGFVIWYIFGVPGDTSFIAAYIKVQDGVFPSVASLHPGATNYERKIQSLFGLKVDGIADERPLLLHQNWPKGLYPLRKDFDYEKRPAVAANSYVFNHVGGEGIYEISVGPIHAGIIEPGHFRFSVAGEEIMLLEPKLGYTHKGSEKLLERLGLEQKLKLSEKISGDSSFSHSLAFVGAVEELAGINVPRRAEYLRTVYAELERLANHLGDIGFIMLDASYNFGGAQGARLRERLMQINDHLSGSRFLRNVNVYGGVSKDISPEQSHELIKDLTSIAKDLGQVIAVAENSVTLMGRLKGAGTLPRKVADDLGIMGLAGRAVGIKSDTRVDYPYGAYDEVVLKHIALETGGDVYARFSVRIKEVHSSIELILSALKSMPAGPICAQQSTELILRKNSLAISSVEGWRGEIIYFIRTDSRGEICRVAVRDPSMVNWQALPYAGFRQMVPDFPLINKSFNMSYSGNDL